MSEVINLKVNVDATQASAALDKVTADARRMGQEVERPRTPRAPRLPSGQPDPRAFGERLELGKRAFEFTRGGSLDAGIGLARSAFAGGGAAGVAAFSGVGAVILGTVSAINKASDAFADFNKDITKNADTWAAVGSMWEDFTSGIADFFTNIAEGILDLFPPIRDAIEERRKELQRGRELERDLAKRKEEAEKKAKEEAEYNADRRRDFDGFVKQAFELKKKELAEQEIARKGLELAPKINMTATAARYGTQEAIDIMDSGGPMAAMVELQRVTNDLLRKLNTPQQVLELM